MTDIKAFLGRGALAGAFGGVAAAIFQLLVTERQIRKALALEAARGTAAHEEMFSRGTQVIGGMAGAVLYGVLVGVLFGFTCAVLWRSLPAISAFTRSVNVAAAGFVTWALVPMLKYPANPPAVGNPDTIGQRTASYLVLMVASTILAALAWELWKNLTRRGFSGAKRFAPTVGGYLAAITAVYVLLPSNPDAVDAPAALIWHFRVDALAGNALLWLVLGTTFGWLADRVVSRASREVADRESLAV